MGVVKLNFISEESVQGPRHAFVRSAGTKMKYADRANVDQKITDPLLAGPNCTVHLGTCLYKGAG